MNSKSNNTKTAPPTSSSARLEISDVDPWENDEDLDTMYSNNKRVRNQPNAGIIESCLNYLQTKRGLTILFSTLAIFLIAIITSLRHDDISVPHSNGLSNKKFSRNKNSNNSNGIGETTNENDLVPPKKGMAYLTPREFLDIRTAHPGESVLVTGGLGFIGSHVVDLLLHRGFHVTILDDESNGHNHNAYVDMEMVPNDITVVGDLPPLPEGDDENGSSFPWEEKHKMHLKKTRTKNKNANGLEDDDDRYFTHVIHLAAAISVAESMNDPDKYERINYGGSEKVLEWIIQYNHRVAMLASGYNANGKKEKQRNMQQSDNKHHSLPLIRKVVAASSAAIYGDPDPSLLPLRESVPYGGLSPYADTKYRMEGLMRAFVEKQNEHNDGLNALPAASATALRFFNVYGPRQDPKNPYSGVISLFLEAAVNDMDITILGDGEMTRDFVYVKDVARAIVMALLQEGDDESSIGSNGSGTTPSPSMEKKHATFSVYNVCTGKSITINTLASQVKKSMESTSRITHLAPRVGDIRESRCNPNGAKEGMGFVSAVSQEVGLEKTADWFRLERDERRRRMR
eukprot:CAMPEP_0171362504 /NCGR_PEP_ID=MMETSP0879-20121228/2685_1 /TAXON_ID=67004 /ORGANISM="Thalassiosira weissflogii, Strain CCMP1336" /LENGTH=570 /DNA_ID=CAMNT_0011869395 /DNA_START=365 /DNA_END=2077 /DNA_ORIENTATION=+